MNNSRVESGKLVYYIATRGRTNHRLLKEGMIRKVNAGKGTVTICPIAEAVGSTPIWRYTNQIIMKK